METSKYRSIISDPDIVGCYVTRTQFMPSHTSGDKTFVLNKKSQHKYVPLVDLISLNNTRELVLKKEEGTKSDVLGISGGRYSDKSSRDKHTRASLDLSANDVLANDMVIILNFTSKPITTNTSGEFRKTYAPIDTSHFANTDLEAGLRPFHGKVVIYTIRSINNPDKILKRVGIENYLGAIREKLKDYSSACVKETIKMNEFVMDSIANSDLTDIEHYNSIRVVSSISIDGTLIDSSENETVFIRNKNLYISNRNMLQITTCLTTDSHMLPDEFSRENSVISNSISCYMVDNRSAMKERYINVAGTVVDVPKIKDQRLEDGLYVYVNYGKDSSVVRRVSSLEELTSNGYVYSSREEASEGADLRSKLKQQQEDLDREHRKEMLAMESASKLKQQIQEEATIKAKKELEETKLHMEKFMLEMKALQEKDKLSALEEANKMKLMYDRHSYEMEDRRSRRKDYYEERTYEREDSISTTKAAVAMAGVALATIGLVKAFGI